MNEVVVADESTFPQYTVEEQLWENTVSAYTKVMGNINSSHSGSPTYLSKWGETSCAGVLEEAVEWLEVRSQWIAEAKELRESLLGMIAAGYEAAYDAKRTEMYEWHDAKRDREYKARQAAELEKRMADRAVGAVVAFKTSYTRWTVEAVNPEGAILSRDNFGKIVKRRVTLEQLAYLGLWLTAEQAAEMAVKAENVVVA
jgi:hypothetical protein